MRALVAEADRAVPARAVRSNAPPLRYSLFVIRSSFFVIHHSSFAIRHSPVSPPHGQHIAQHVDDIADAVDRTARVIHARDRHLDNPQAQLARQEQRFHVEAEPIAGVPREDLPGCGRSEALEAALGIAKAGNGDGLHHEVEDAAHERAQCGWRADHS